MTEIWKNIVGYEGIYEVSNFGRVRTVKNGRMHKERLTFDGYVKATLTVNSKSKDFRVHRLVAQSFIPNPENKETVNHKDGVKTNNYVDNLEWATRSEQVYHSYELGLKIAMSGEKHSNSKLTPEEVREIRKIYVKGDKKFGAMNLGRIYNVGATTIENVVKRKTYKNIE